MPIIRSSARRLGRRITDDAVVRSAFKPIPKVQSSDAINMIDGLQPLGFQTWDESTDCPNLGPSSWQCLWWAVRSWGFQNNRRHHSMPACRVRNLHQKLFPAQASATNKQNPHAGSRRSRDAHGLIPPRFSPPALLLFLLLLLLLRVISSRLFGGTTRRISNISTE
ncbi:hypothetical protein CGRA01v4_05456 [Colletotrichum graminicola]|nr:hypothetical protein CGRA01v4_05456 [Colletotrichum graminicola]